MGRMSEALTSLEPGRLEPEAAGARVAAMYERHARSVYGLCRLLLRDSHEAEDAAQATFLAAHKAIVRGGEPREPGAWLAAIARNECRGRIRDRMREPVPAGEEALDGLEAPGADPSERMADPAVAKALASLSDRQREAVVLHDAFGLRAREVGAALDLSLPAVEALLFRARRQLRMRLQPVSGALAIPVGLRDVLAQLIPGFADTGAGTGAAAVGAAGAGLFAKLAGAPAAAKVAAATVAVTAAGSAAVVSTERPSDPRLRTDGVGVVGERRGSPTSRLAGGTFLREDDSVSSSSGRSGRSEDGSDDSSGPGPDGDRDDDGDGHDDDDGRDDGSATTKGSTGSGSSGADDEGSSDHDDDEGGGSGGSGSSGSNPGSGGLPSDDEEEPESGGDSGSSGSSGSGSGSSGSGSGGSSGGELDEHDELDGPDDLSGSGSGSADDD